MPQAAEQIASFFGTSLGKDLVYKKGPGKLSWDDLGKDEGLERVVKSEVLFSKLEDELVNELRERYSGSQKERKECADKTHPLSNAPDADKPASRTAEAPELRFAKNMDLRVAKIIKIERHPKADKLYIETLETVNGEGGIEERVIVSGLVPFYREEELLNRKIILACNLKPAKLRGVESRGMLLAADDHEGPADSEGKAGMRVEVLEAGDAPVGTRVKIDGIEPPAALAEIDIETFFSIPMTVKDNTVMVGGKALTLEGKPIKTKIIVNGEVH
jgi:methionyl-tRNA synthetase